MSDPKTSFSTGVLNRYRNYLVMLGRAQLHGLNDAKIDLSGVIQVTMCEAVATAKLAVMAAEEQLAWLRRVFANNLTDEIRRFQTDKRDVSREQLLEESSARIDDWLAAEQSSPSERADRNEHLLRLANALPHLPDDQRCVVERHYLQGCILSEIGAEMGRSREAIAGLLFRGLCRLRELLAEDFTGIRK